MVKVLHNQTLFDIALQYYANIEIVFDLAIANAISITDELLPGQELILIESVLVKKDLVDYFKNKKQIIATAVKTTINSTLDYQFAYQLPALF